VPLARAASLYVPGRAATQRSRPRALSTKVFDRCEQSCASQGSSGRLWAAPVRLRPVGNRVLRGVAGRPLFQPEQGAMATIVRGFVRQVVDRIGDGLLLFAAVMA
jgi:hypothetical protein